VQGNNIIDGGQIVLAFTAAYAAGTDQSLSCRTLGFGPPGKETS
jgi:hypothetical protein